MDGNYTIPINFDEDDSSTVSSGYKICFHKLITHVKNHSPLSPGEFGNFGQEYHQNGRKWMPASSYASFAKCYTGERYFVIF